MVNPKVPTQVYAGTEGNGVFGSVDSGGTWTKVGQGLPINHPVTALAVAPQAVGAPVYAGTPAGLFKNTDPGGQWTKLLLPPAGGSADPGVVSIAISPSAPNTVLVAAEYNSPGLVFRSTDGGQTWATVPLPDGAALLAFAPSSASVVYAAPRSGGVHRSTDGGSTWSPVNAGLPPGMFVSALAVGTGSPDTVYAGTNGAGVFQSFNGGSQWHPINSGMETQQVRTLLVDGTAIYAGTATGFFAPFGVWKTVDDGATWTPSPGDATGPGTDASALVRAGGGGPTLLVGMGDGIRGSTDGSEWRPRQAGLRATWMKDLHHVAASATALLALTREGRLWRYSSGQWTPGPAGAPLDTLVGNVTSGADNVAWIATNNGIFKSIDAGATWVPANSGLPPGSVTRVVVAPSRPQRLYAFQVNPHTPPFTIGHRLFATDDGGVSWRVANDLVAHDCSVQNAIVATRDPNTVYVNCWSLILLQSGLIRSVDAGTTFQGGVSGGLPPFSSIHQFAVDPFDPAVLFVATVGQQVFQSSASAATWTPLATPGRAVLPDILDRRLYFGSDEGVRVVPSEPQQPFAQNNGLSNTFVQSLTFGPDGAEVFAGTAGGGVFQYGRLSDLAVDSSHGRNLVVRRPSGRAATQVAIRNLGPDPAGSVVVHFGLPRGGRVVGASSAQGQCETLSTCRLGALPVGGVARVNLDLLMVRRGNWPLNLTVSSSTADPAPSSNRTELVVSRRSAPIVTGLRPVCRRRSRPCDAALRFTLSDPGHVVISLRDVNTKRPVSTVTVRARRGANVVRIPRRFARQTIPPGRYLVVLRSRGDGLFGRQLRLVVRLV